MILLSRRKLSIIALLIYWPTIFVLTHIPVPSLIRRVGVSDKTLHFIGYMVLTFLLWFAISGDRKVNWRTTAVWWVLLLAAVYGAADEWLQGQMSSRSADVVDFLANLAGGFAGLLVVSLFEFWSAWLVLSGVTIFLLENVTKVKLSELLPLTDAAFHLFGYAVFSLVWIRNMRSSRRFKAPQPGWLAAVLIVPAGFLGVVELFSVVVVGRGLEISMAIFSVTGIVTVVAVVYIRALLEQRLTGKPS